MIVHAERERADRELVLTERQRTTLPLPARKRKTPPVTILLFAEKRRNLGPPPGLTDAEQPVSCRPLPPEPAAASNPEIPKESDDHDEDEQTTVSGEPGKKSKPKGVNGGWDKDELHRLALLPRPHLPEQLKQGFHVLYESVSDFMTTLARAAITPGCHFEWPLNNASLSQTLQIAVHHLPPGYMTVIENRKIFRPSSSRALHLAKM